MCTSIGSLVNVCLNTPYICRSSCNEFTLRFLYGSLVSHPMTIQQFRRSTCRIAISPTCGQLHLHCMHSTRYTDGHRGIRTTQCSQQLRWIYPEHQQRTFQALYTPAAQDVIEVKEYRRSEYVIATPKQRSNSNLRNLYRTVMPRLELGSSL